ncbi:hypothetical protein [Roseimicrobium sp. ORNL1]|uniref:hypothetical protein n=1 Tax=Roseimicrobium sp. ORNL1 TaxID=2711231 RepID=UPI0013E15209|nr:hypothetical protein [Roseimicrobium sp. ORNL1]QIF01715.1 hypothetical protein G5S37_09320 [Roseimicrobium sp. ORNL1]
MKLFYSATTPEVAVLATREEYRALTEALRTPGQARMHASQEGNPEPYAAFLQGIVVTCGGEERVSVIVNPECSTLEFRGCGASLAMLAVNVASFGAEADMDSHSHEEYYEGHFYLEKDSLPVVFELH